MWLHYRMAWAWRSTSSIDTVGAAEDVVEKLGTLFESLGRCPAEIQSDNGPQFTSDLLQCAIYFVHTR